MAFTYCENCGEKIDESSKFCPNCGYSKAGAQAPRNGEPQNGAYTDGQNSYGNIGGNPNGYGNNQNPYGNPNGYGNNQNPYGNPNGYGNNQNPYGNPNGYGNNGQPPYGNYPPYGNRPPYGGQNRKMNTGIVVFAVIVIACFNMLFGFLALMMAMKAPNEPTEELMEKKNRTAIILCVIGVVFGIIATVAYFALILNGSGMI